MTVIRLALRFNERKSNITFSYINFKTPCVVVDKIVVLCAKTTHM
nr:MAG TPA: hypothetical protein [Caudoviricetes sp.]